MTSNTKLSIGVVVLVLLCAGLAVWQLGTGPQDAGPPGERERSVSGEESAPPMGEFPATAGGDAGSPPVPEWDPGTGGGGPVSPKGSPVAGGPPGTGSNAGGKTSSGRPDRKAEVRGRIRAESSGLPVEGVTIGIEYDVQHNGGRVPEGGAPRLTLKSDAEGNFSFADLPAGSYRITFAHPDYAHRALLSAFIEGGAEPTELSVPLIAAPETLGAIEGWVSRPDTSPFSGARIVVHSKIQQVWVETKTNEEGYYRVERLPAGYYRISLLGEVEQAGASSSASLYERVQTTRVTPRETVRIDFKGTGVLTGVVIDEIGEVMPGVTVEVSPVVREGAYRKRAADADEDGNFRIENAGVGWNLIRVNNKKQGWSVQVTTVNLSGYDQEITVILAQGGINGRITLAEDGKPPMARRLFPGITLQKPLPGPTGVSGPNLAYANPDRQGHFDMRGISDGKYRLRVHLDGYHLEERDVEIRGGEPAPVLSFALREIPAGTVRIRVTDASGNPAEGVFFSGRPAGGAWHTFRMEHPEPGIYTSDKVPLGRRQFILHRPDLTSKVVSVEVTEEGTAEVTVSMDPK